MEKLYSGWPEWELTEKIGEGSFGKVYRARRIEGSRQFYSAIKIITISGKGEQAADVGMSGNDEASLRSYLKSIADDCINEIEMMDRLKGNSNIVAVEDFKLVEHKSDPGWDIYIRMELLESFVEYTKHKKLTEMDVIRLGIDICHALELCERQKIIHRDIKPANIFVSSSGSFKLGDFGIARKLERANSTMSHKGTYSYMAPEIFYGERHYDSTIDTYSLGLVLYLLLNRNRVPFLDPGKPDITYLEKDEAIQRRMKGERLPSPSQASPAMAQIILKACSYNPKDRYQSASQMKADLENLEKGTGSGSQDATQSWQTVQDGEERTQAFGTEQRGVDHTQAWSDTESGIRKKSNQSKSGKKRGIPTGVLLGVGALAVIAAGFLCAQIFFGETGKSVDDSDGKAAKNQDINVEGQTADSETTVTPLPTPSNTAEPSAEPTAAAESSDGAVSTQKEQNAEVSYETYYVVNCQESITLRTSPSTSASEICQIPLGAAVSFVGGAQNGFYEIIYNGNQGFGLASYLSKQPPASTRSSEPSVNYETYYVVNCQESITLRTSPSTSASEICQIPLGAAVSYVGSASNGFYEVIYDGSRGYALASYLSTSPWNTVGNAVGTCVVVNCQESITLRTSPSTSAAEICQIPLGATVSFSGVEENGFYLVVYDGNTGYALKEYLERQ